MGAQCSAWEDLSVYEFGPLLSLSLESSWLILLNLRCLFVRETLFRYLHNCVFSSRCIVLQIRNKNKKHCIRSQRLAASCHIFCFYNLFYFFLFLDLQILTIPRET